ncbi:ADP-ribosyltransferase [Streptomyces sp. DT2A-34]|uniref:putative T7SS-secreted protein n=1 Tax=Streptomyces sp. DT2A-34 TaxID=3051182 RepID=UPI00265BAFE3|nr:ADP-ribosyltransferase [Streptomyces sp. DT2A-34]MDO0911336.1 ADP-ribosyltransferase [Streptomyces sp. DT2A-34]
MSGLPGFDELGNATQGLRDGIADGAQFLAHGAAEGLDAVGAHKLADKTEGASSWLTEHLSASTSELELGESDDPAQLLHGDASRIREAAVHLKKFSAAFERTGQALRKMDADDWRGAAADRFREKVSTHPKRWLKAADAFEDAASAMTSYAHTVEWARGQAKEAVAKYKAAQARTDAARERYDAQVEAYNNALWQQETSWTAARGSTDQLPQKPGDFQDPGAEERADAEHLLKNARHKRDADAETLASALARAYSQAPPAPQGTELLKRSASNTLKNTVVGAEHRLGGVVKAGASMVRLCRTVSPTDPYNISHPGQYVANLAAVSTGLLHSANHPTELVKGVVGEGWSTDRNQALGTFATNFIPVGGAAKAGASTAAHAAENALAHDAAKAAGSATAKEAGNAAAHAGTTAATDAAKDMSAGAAKIFEEFGGGIDNNLTSIEASIGAAAPDAAQGVSHGGAQQFQHAAEPATSALDGIGREIDGIQVNHPDSPTAASHENTVPPQATTDHTAPESGPVEWTAPPTQKNTPTPEAEPAPQSGPYQSDNANKAFNDFAPKPPQVDEAVGHDLDAIGKEIDDLHVNEPHAPDDVASSSNTSASQHAEPGNAPFSNAKDFLHREEETYAYGGEHSRSFIEELPQEQFDSLKHYSTSHGCDLINGHLRNPDAPQNPLTAEHIDNIDKMFDNVPKTQEPLILRRGTGIDHWLKEFNVADARELRGLELGDEGFMSTSLGEAAFKDKPAKLHLELPEGRPAIWMDRNGSTIEGRGIITEHPTEREMLLPRGTKFEVTDVYKEGGQWQIHGRIV